MSDKKLNRFFAFRRALARVELALLDAVPMLYPSHAKQNAVCLQGDSYAVILRDLKKATMKAHLAATRRARK